MNEIRRRIMASRAQEAREMRAFGGARHAGSGNGSRKADGRVNGSSWLDFDHALVEFKRTDKDQITLKVRDLEQLRQQALLHGRTPWFGIELGSSKPRQYYVFEDGDVHELIGLLREKDQLIRELQEAADGTPSGNERDSGQRVEGAGEVSPRPERGR